HIAAATNAFPACCVDSIFFLSMRRSPTSTLFPYTTLFRSYVILPKIGLRVLSPETVLLCEKSFCNLLKTRQFYIACVRQSTCFRSEEHTSELQSRENLVCRLLLAKKKKKIKSKYDSAELVD